MKGLKAIIFIAAGMSPSLAAAESVLVTPGDSLAAAFRRLAPGDELVFGAGTFDLGAGFDATIDGAEGATILIRGAGAVLEAPGGDFTLRLQGSHFVVADLDVRGPRTALTLIGDNILVRDSAFSAAATGVFCEDCADTVITACEFTDIFDGTSAAIASEAFINGGVLGNWIHDVAGDGIVLTGRTVNSRVADNVVEQIGNDGIRVEFPPEIGAGPADNVIGNFISEVGETGLAIVGPVNAATNIITNFGSNGIHATIGEANLDTIIAHNTVVGDSTCFRATEWPLSPAVNVVGNNAFYCEGATAIIFDDGVGLNTIVDGNRYLGAADFPGESVLGNGLTDFADAEGGDYYPAAGSALVDSGVTLSIKPVDFNGTPRGTLSDVGAYERRDAENPKPAPGGGFKSGSGGVGEPPPGGENPGGGGGGSSGGANGGGTSGFPERAGGCASTGDHGGGALSLLLVGLLAVGRRRR